MTAAATAAFLAPPAALAGAGGKVRPAYCAGRWYPKDAEALAARVDDLLKQASPPEPAGKPVAIIAPHAGYRFSAPVAAEAYAALRGHTFQRVIVLAFSHQHSLMHRGIDVPKHLAAYSTPLGELPLDRQACETLLANDLFSSRPGLDRGEHSLELQLPFLQRVLGEFRLVPLLVGQLEPEEHTRAAAAILPLLDGDTLLVTSTDFTHFGPNFGYVPFTRDIPDKLHALADGAAAPIQVADFDGFQAHLDKTDDTICGRVPVALLLRILSMRGGAEGVRAAFDTSGRLLKDWSSSVTYQSFVFTDRKGTLGTGERETLLRLARETAQAYLQTKPRPKVDRAALPEKLLEKACCFVTFENQGRLRGCIGNLRASVPLYQAVTGNAISACRDQRFAYDPVTVEELDSIDIEISYLTPMQPIDRPEDIVVGRHGLLIVLDRASGVLLPQVAYERGWPREEFLAQVCRKAGLPPDAWKRPEAKIYSFEAEVFGEGE